MKTTILSIPEGIKYLSDWEGFKDLPKHEHYILAKEICGCGATEAFIKSNEPLIIAMPRKHLLFNKYSQHIGENVFLYRFLDLKQYFSDKTPSKAELEQFDRLFIEYVRNGGIKILATYDSLDRITGLLKQEGIELNRFRVVVDEFQQIIGDAPFKATVEHQFYTALKKFESVVYLSATPFLQSYLEMTEQFKDLTFVQLKWPEHSIRKADVNVIKLTKSITDKCCEIIRNYKSGNVPYVNVGDERIESKEAVFFLNDVKSIINVIKKSGLEPDEVNILCAPRKENHDRINSLNKGHDENQSKFTRGVIPGRGEKHKMFTFCTSTVYIGADFNSESAYSYIFANPNVESLTIDVGTDIQQIVGRQRLDENPFRLKADLYYYLKKPLVSEKEMKETIDNKRAETRKHIENFENAKHKDSLLKSLEAMIDKGHADQYCCISEDENGYKTVVENSLIAIAEKRAWDIANTIYKGDLSLIKALKNSVNIHLDVDDEDPDVKKLFMEWSKDSQFKRRVILYCELREKKPDVLKKCAFIPTYYHQYYDALGRKGLEDLQWRQDYIKEALAPTPVDDMPHHKIVEHLTAKFHEGNEYPKDEIKQALTEIYAALGVKGKPSASDIQRYFTIKESSKRIDKKKVATIKILSHWQTGISIFSGIANVKNPIFGSNVNSILETIRVGDWCKIKSKILKLQAVQDKNEFDTLKRRLPVITWNGVFTHRDASGCSVYSSFTALDFDHVNNLDECKHWLQTFPCVYAYFKTPSGKGLKAIILHDNRNKANHADLYSQLLKIFNGYGCDTSTSDLGRGNYLSYDPDLWINPNVQPFQYEPSEVIQQPKLNAQTVVKGDKGEPILIQNDDYTSFFLQRLSMEILTDESIINMLRKKWTQQSLDRGRNNTAFTYAGILCKAGVEQSKALSFIIELIPDLPQREIVRAVKFAYGHNIFGSHRRTYLKRKRH